MKWNSLHSVTLDGRPLFVGVTELLESLQRLPSTEEQVLHAFRIASMIEHYVPAYHYRHNLTAPVETHDVFKLINVYGYGNCKQISMLMQFMLDHAGVPNRVLALQTLKGDWSHVVNEAFYDGKWHMFDPDLGIYFLDAFDDVISANEFADNGFDRAVGDFDSRMWGRHILTLNDDLFHPVYRSVFDGREVFDMIDDRYPWKKEFLENYGLSEWYCADRPTCFIPENCGIRSIAPGDGVVEGRVVASPEDFDFHNLIFTFHDVEHTFSLNRFPLPVLDIHIASTGGAERTGRINVRGESYDYTVTGAGSLTEQILEQNPTLFDLPNYSFSIRGEQELGTIEVTTQASASRNRILDYLHQPSLESS